MSSARSLKPVEREQMSTLPEPKNDTQSCGREKNGILAP